MLFSDNIAFNKFIGAIRNGFQIKGSKLLGIIKKYNVISQQLSFEITMGKEENEEGKRKDKMITKKKGKHLYLSAYPFLISKKDANVDKSGRYFAGSSVEAAFLVVASVVSLVASYASALAAASFSSASSWVKMSRSSK